MPTRRLPATNTNSRTLLHRNERGKWRTVCQDKLGTPHNIGENTHSNRSKMDLMSASSVHTFVRVWVCCPSVCAGAAGLLFSSRFLFHCEGDTLDTLTQPTHWGTFFVPFDLGAESFCRLFSSFGSRFKLMLNTIDLARQARDTHSILLKGKGVCCRACE